MESEAWNFFEDILPPEVAEIVFSFLSLEDIVYVSLVCKTWNNYFDTKDIWRKIIEHYYGEISPRSVDLSQPFRWKRTFIILHNAHSWSKTLKNTTVTYKSSYDTPERAIMGPSGHFIHTSKSWISIKMAGKIVQVKRDPVTIDEKKWLPTSYPLATAMLASSKGKYLITKDYYSQYFLVDGEKLATMDVGDHSATRLQIAPNSETHRHTRSIGHPKASFNSRFVVLASSTLYNSAGGDIYHAVFDLQSTCHCIHAHYKDEPKNNPLTRKRTEPKCNEYAINTSYGALAIFVSQEVPDLFVFIVNEVDEEKSKKNIGRYVFYPKMVIWKHGKGWLEEKTVHFKKCTGITDITNFSEHVIDEHHWICFDTGIYETRIIDLNNTSNQFKLDQIPIRLWIPKKNKIILASGTKITVFDLTLKRWTSRITCQSDVRAMTLSKTARILFVADNQFVHAYHWETGKLIGSVNHWQHHSYPAIETIHIGYDQVIILNGKLFLKMPAKCDM